MAKTVKAVPPSPVAVEPPIDSLAFSEVVQILPSPKTVVFSGARPQMTPGGWDKTNAFVVAAKCYLFSYVEFLTKRGYCRFVTGGNLGSDEWFADAVLFAKTSNPDIAFELVLPFHGYEKAWKDDTKQAFSALCEKADKVSYADEINPPPKSLDAARKTIANLMNRNSIAAKMADLIVLFGEDKPVTAMKIAANGKRTVSVSFAGDNKFLAREG